MSHTLPELGYSYDALEPHIDAATMEIHHTKHHNTYVTGLNAALESAPELQGKPVCELISDLASAPEAIQTPLRNHGGGHLNHSIFWKIIAPGGSAEPTGKVAEQIIADFGSLDEFKDEFAKAAATRFGSGWAWVCVNPQGKLIICSTPNQDNPLMAEFAGTCGNRPLIGLDVWEHAYYLNYQNRRPDYIAAFWSVLNWDVVEERYQNIISSPSCAK